MKFKAENSSTPYHPVALWLLKTLLLALSVSALVPGIELLIDPSGKSIRFPQAALVHSPFSNYLIPGILLSLFMGLLPLMAWFSLWKKSQNTFLDRINPFPMWHWAWTLALFSGLVLII